jgi:7-cyano-7-deazaguanine reductase
MNRLIRRQFLKADGNPGARLDYVVTLEGAIPGNTGIGPQALGLRYVPDKLVLQPAAFGRYLEALAAETWPSIECLAVTILDDMNNEVVPRWVQVIVSILNTDQPGVESHGVILEDRRPKWDNPALLSRLRRY